MNTRELERGFSKVPGEKGKTCEYPLNVARGDSRSVSKQNPLWSRREDSQASQADREQSAPVIKLLAAC